MVELDGRVVADVVDAVRRGARAGIGRRGVPVRIRRGHAVGHAHDALDDVVDVREVAAHPAVVEDVDGFSGEDGLGEQEQGHVGAAPGAVDGEEPQAGRRQPVEVGIGVGHQLVGLLGGGVERDGVVHDVVDGEREMGVEAVDRTAGGVGQMRRLRVPAGFEDVQEPDEVALDVGAGIRNRIAHAGLRGEVDHAVERLAGKQLAHGGFVFEAALDEGEARFLAQQRQARFLERRVVVVVDVVEADDGVAAREQRAGHVESDEAGGAGDEHVHGYVDSRCSPARGARPSRR